MLICPHCQNGVTENPALAGQLVPCPHCAKTFCQPAAIAQLPGQPVSIPAEQQRPVNILVTGPPPRPRLDADGWFARAFSTTSGVLVALLLFLAVIPIVGFTLLAFFVAIVASIGEVSEYYQSGELAQPAKLVKPGESALMVRAKREAGTQLRRMGLKSLEGKTELAQDGSRVTLDGYAQDDLGTVRDVGFTWNVTGGAWKMLEYSIDGTMFKRK